MARLEGTDADDYLRGGSGADIIYGYDGYDRIYAGSGNDIVYAGSYEDRAYLENGNDTFSGGDGSDVAYGGDGRDTLRGDTGDDILYGGDGRDILIGGAGIDYLYGDGDSDTISGEGGDDWMRGNSGIDRLDGGSGNDAASFLDLTATQGAVVDLRTGTVSNDGFGNAEALVSVERLIGTNNADTLLGNDADNIFWGTAGDTIRGFGGTDAFIMSSVEGATLDGGTGLNSLLLTGEVRHVGADGKVTTVEADQDMVVDLAKGVVINDGFGFSTAITGFTAAITGDGNDTIVGSSTANQLRGGWGDDHLSGGGGKDLLVGGYGADTLTGGAGADVFGFGIDFEYSNGGFDYGDVVTDFAPGDKLDIQPGYVPLRFVGTESLDNYAYAINYSIENGDTYVHVKNYDLPPFEMTIKLLGVHQLTANDFLHLGQPGSPASPILHDMLTPLPSTHLGDAGLLAIA